MYITEGARKSFFRYMSWEGRRQVTILDRQGLTEASCECYQLVRARFVFHLANTRDASDCEWGATSMLPDQSAVYYPEELSLLGQILDQAVQSLPPSMRTPQNRAAIAKDILACAATGERDPIEIGLAALINLKVTVAA